uniref:Uncharacterized protein n=1 Tax=Anguilla anguilla TaxID=7936 RepID=A0A0E9X0B6_ANGAN
MTNISGFTYIPICETGRVGRGEGRAAASRPPAPSHQAKWTLTL